MSENDMQPPDPVCRFCEDWCSGTCEGAREHAIENTPRCDRCGHWLRERVLGVPVCDFCY